MTNILITVADQKLFVTNAPTIASQDVNEDYVIFTFNGWDGYGKTAIFYRAEEEDNPNKVIYQSAVDGDGKALIPWEVTAEDGKIKIGVYGAKDDIKKTSDIITYKIVKGMFVEGEESQPPTPGLYEQILTVAGEMQGLYNNEKSARIIGDNDERVARMAADNTLRSSINAEGARIDGLIVNPPEVVGGAKKMTTQYIWTGAGSPDSPNAQAGRWIVLQETSGQRTINLSDVVSVQYGYKLDALDSSTPSEYPSEQMERQTDGLYYQMWEYNDGSLNYVYFQWSLKPGTINFNPSVNKCWVCFEITYIEDATVTEIVDARIGVDATVYQTLGTAIRTQINNLAQSIDAQTDILNTKLKRLSDTDINLVNGYYSVSSIGNTVTIGSPSSTSSSYRCGYLACSPGDTFYVSGYGTSSVRLWAFIGSDNKVISRSTSVSTQVTNEKCIAPAGAAYVIFNYSNSRAHGHIKGENMLSEVSALLDILGIS